MKIHRLAPAAFGIALGLVAAFATGAGAATAPTTLRFEEVEKGSTFAFIDNAPKSELHHGFPVVISAGDVAVGTTPLAEGAKKIGTLRTVCTATKTAKVFDNAGFMCQGTFKLPGGTLVGTATVDAHQGTEGAIIGGTGTYAGANGTFYSKEGKGSRSKVTVSLVERG